jgi:hypothetical protein
MAVSRKPSCPSGHVLRESYRSKSGKVVSARCIRKTGIFRGKASNKAAMRRSKALESAKMAVHMSRKAGMHVPTRCPPGMTLRAGYVRRSYSRKSGSHVHRALTAPSCITQRGKSGRKIKIFGIDPKKDHFLSEFGYHDIVNKTQEERHAALHKLIAHLEEKHGQMAAWNYAIRALNYRALINRNTNPNVSRIMKSDQRAISKLYKKAKQQSTTM